MPAWLQQSLLRQEMDRFKPDMEKVKAMLAAQSPAQSPTQSPAQAATGTGDSAKPKYSEFVMTLSLEPMEETKPKAAEDPAPPGGKPAAPGQSPKR